MDSTLFFGVFLAPLLHGFMAFSTLFWTSPCPDQLFPLLRIQVPFFNYATGASRYQCAPKAITIKYQHIFLLVPQLIPALSRFSAPLTFPSVEDSRTNGN